MEVNTISELLKYNNPISPWSEFLSVPELYMEKGRRYVVRLVGPSYKAKRCFVSRGNLAMTNSSTRLLKDLLNGKDVLSKINLNRVPNNLREEVIKANDKSLWSKCLTTSCVIIGAGSRDGEGLIHSKGGESLCHLTIPSSGVASLIDMVKDMPEVCLSGVYAHNLIIHKHIQGGVIEISISTEASFLRKDSINELLNEGIPNTKKFYLDQNSSNIRKRGGYFYSFCDEKAVSSLDKHLEPLQTIKNYFEEDKQHDHIKNNPKKLAELEGIEPFDFIDVE